MLVTTFSVVLNFYSYYSLLRNNFSQETSLKDVSKRQVYFRYLTLYKKWYSVTFTISIIIIKRNL